MTEHMRYGKLQPEGELPHMDESKLATAVTLFEEFSLQYNNTIYPNRVSEAARTLAANHPTLFDDLSTDELAMLIERQNELELYRNNLVGHLFDAFFNQSKLTELKGRFLTSTLGNDLPDGKRIVVEDGSFVLHAGENAFGEIVIHNSPFIIGKNNQSIIINRSVKNSISDLSEINGVYVAYGDSLELGAAGTGVYINYGSAPTLTKKTDYILFSYDATQKHVEIRYKRSASQQPLLILSSSLPKINDIADSERRLWRIRIDLNKPESNLTPLNYAAQQRIQPDLEQLQEPLTFAPLDNDELIDSVKTFNWQEYRQTLDSVVEDIQL